MIEEEDFYFGPPEHQADRNVSQPLILRDFIRTLVFTGFTLIEYIRSARILIELIAAAACYAIFLRSDQPGVDPQHFFLIAGLFTLGLTIYTTSAMIGLGDRSQGYLILVRRIGRTGYLLGLYTSALVVIASIYGLLSVATFALSHFQGLSLTSWLLGTLPLLLNVGLLAALFIMLSPLVFSTGWRLLVLGLIALAFSGSFFGNAALDSLTPTIRNIIYGLQALLSWPLVPAFSGFELARTRDYSGSAPVILIAQSSLLVALLGISLYTFSRREVILSAE